MSLSQRVYFAIGTALEEQMDIDWSVSDQAIQQQQKVTAARREAQLASAAGKPTAFVDSKGGLMRARPLRPPMAQAAPPLPPSFKLHSMSDEVLAAVRARRVWPPDSSFQRVRLGTAADMILVGSVLQDYNSPQALQARLDGARLVDKTGRLLHFRCSMQMCHSVIFVSQAFQDAYPLHFRVLHACASRSPTIGKDKNPRLEIRNGVPDERLKFPSRTFYAVLSNESAEPCKRLDMQGKDVEVERIDLAALFRMYASCYDS